MSLFDAIGSLGSSLIGGGASIYGGMVAADAAKDAGKQSLAQYQQSRRDFLPWLQAGTGGVNKLRDILLGGQSSEYLQTPGYESRFQEGIRALDNSASSRGMIDSGAQRKALMQYGQDYATDEYNQRLNRLGMLAGYGQNAAGSVGQLGSVASGNYGNALQNAGAIRGSSYIGAANTLNSGIGNAIRGFYY